MCGDTTSRFFRLFAAKVGALALQFRRLRRDYFLGGLEVQLVSVEPTLGSVRPVDTGERTSYAFAKPARREPLAASI